MPLGKPVPVHSLGMFCVFFLTSSHNIPFYDLCPSSLNEESNSVIFSIGWLKTAIRFSLVFSMQSLTYSKYLKPMLIHFCQQVFHVVFFWKCTYLFLFHCFQQGNVVCCFGVLAKMGTRRKRAQLRLSLLQALRKQYRAPVQ